MSRQDRMPTFDEQYPDVTFYEGDDDDPAVSMAVHHCWISALFESLEAAKSWANHPNEAEEAFAKLNVATGGKGEVLLGVRP